MTDNQNTIETLQRIKEYFESVGFSMSANKLRVEIEKLQPKPEYVVGKAYTLWSPHREEYYDAIYTGGEQPWARYDAGIQAMKYGSLHPEYARVVDTEKKEILVTEEDFKNAPWNTVVRRRTNGYNTWDIAVVNLSGSWYLDGIAHPHEASDMEQLGPWEVVSLG